MKSRRGTDKHDSHRKGWVMTELIVSMGILAILMGGSILLFHNLGRLNHDQWLRRQGVTLCLAQLDSLTAAGTPLQADACERLWPNWRVDIQQKMGEGDWEGLFWVGVQAQIEGPAGCPVTVTMSRYILPPGETP